MDTFQFEKTFLEKAAGISLRDLLDCPSTQMWTVSMMSNAVLNKERFEDPLPEDVDLVQRLSMLLYSIPYSEKQELFQSCHKMIRERKETAAAKALVRKK